MAIGILGNVEPLVGTLASQTLRGYSAYDIAILHGFEGTEEEWLASLKGDDGAEGPRGYPGPRGEKGDKGDKGDDYILTELDKEAIAELVDVTSAVQDVKIDGESVTYEGIAEIPIATSFVPGVVKVVSSNGLAMRNSDQIAISRASSVDINRGTENLKPIVPLSQHESTFYGLAKAAGDTTQSQSNNPVGTYTDNAKTAIKSMLGITDGVSIDDTAGDGDTDVTWSADKIADELSNAGTVQDVQINGTSILSNGVAEIPIATQQAAGVVSFQPAYGITLNTGNQLRIDPSNDDQVKAGTNAYKPVVPSKQHAATFYGLAKAAGDVTQASSDNPVGTYTDDAKLAIRNMLDVTSGESTTVAVTGTAPVIQAVANARYVCGEVASIDFTPCASGICDVIFTSGTTAAVLTLPQTVKMPEWFDPTTLDTNTVYEISIVDATYGAVMVWQA